MLAFLIVLVVVLVAIIVLSICKKDWFDSIFGNSVIRKVEKKKKLEGQLEVLKKQQKVEVEKVSKESDEKKASMIVYIDSQINAHKASITTLENQKKTQQDLLDEQKKVEIDKCTHNFDRKIVSKMNEIKRLGHYIEAERKNQDDALNPDRPNAPTISEKKILLEDTKVETNKKKTK